MLIQATRQFSYEVARLMSKGEGSLEASMVKAYVCRAAEWVTREALQIHGGMGYAEEFPVSRYFVDARVLSIFEGADETLALKVIARRLLANARADRHRPAPAPGYVGPVDNASLIEAVRVEGEALVVALEDAAVDDLVPTCEGWKVADLAVHVGGFCGFWAHVLCEGTGRPKTPFPDPPEGDELAPWVAAADRPPGRRAHGHAARHRGVDLVRGRPDGRVRRPPLCPRAGRPPLRRPVLEPDLRPHRMPTWPRTASTRSSTSWSPPGPRSGRGTGRVLALRSTDVGAELGGEPRVGPDRCAARPAGRRRPRAADVVGQRHGVRPRAHPVPPPHPEPGRRARRLHRPRGVAPRVHLLSGPARSSARWRPAEPAQPGDRLRPARSPRVTNLVAILREASSIISSPNMTAPDRSSSVALR